LKSRIFYLTQHFYPEAQAAAFRATESALLLHEAGFEVVLITGYPNLKAERSKNKYRGKLFVKDDYRGLKVVRVYTPLDTKKGAFIRLLNYFSFMILAVGAGLFLKKPKIIYASSPPFFVSVAGLIIARFKKARYVIEIRDLWIDFALLLGQLRSKPVIAVMRALEKITYRAADRIVVVTEGYRNHLVGRGVEEEKISVIHAGVDFDKLTLGDGERIRTEMGLQNKFIIGYAGNIGLAQGLEVVVQAAYLLREEEGIAIVIVGDGAERLRLVELARQLNLNNIFITGPVNRSDAADYMASFDSCLVQLLKDPLFDLTLPSKLFECMAYSKPVLLGLGGEAKEIIEKSGGGLLFNVEDPLSLVRQIKALKGHEQETAKVGERGRKFVMEHYDRRQLVNMLGEILKE